MRYTLAWSLSALVLGGCYLFHRAPGESDAPAGPARDTPRASASRDSGVEPASTCVTHTYRPGQKFEPVDMVWVVDSSRSMADEQARIRQIINDFVTDAEARSFDVRLVMITASNIVPAPLGSDTNRYRFVERSVQSREPLQALLDELPSYEDFLRPEAALHFVVVTDDESQLSADDFLRAMDSALGRKFVVHAVASPDVDGGPCRSANSSPQCDEAGLRSRQLCGAAAVGREYYALAQRLGGEEISICVDDWREVFGPLLEAVTPTEIPCAIELGALDAGVSTQVALRQGESMQVLAPVSGLAACGRLRAFYSVDNEQGTEVSLCPAACSATTLQDVELRIQVDCD